MASTSFSFSSQVTEAEVWGFNSIKSSKPSLPSRNFDIKRIDRIDIGGAQIISKVNLESLKRGKTTEHPSTEVFSVSAIEVRETYSIAKEKEIASKKSQFKVESSSNFYIEDVSKQKMIQQITTESQLVKIRTI